jgi:hypothetical protein
MRTRTITLLLGFAVSGLVLASPAAAHAGDDEPSTTATTLQGAVGISDGMAFTGAVITTDGGEAPRRLNAYPSGATRESRNRPLNCPCTGST